MVNICVCVCVCIMCWIKTEKKKSMCVCVCVCELTFSLQPISFSNNVLPDMTLLGQGEVIDECVSTAAKKLKKNYTERL